MQFPHTATAFILHAPIPITDTQINLTIDDGTEHDVLAVEPSSLHGRDEELRTVGVGSSVGHGHNTRTGVLEGEVLVVEFSAVDGLAAGAVVIGEVATLAHEVGDDTVEAATLVAEALLAGAEGTEVLRRPRHYVRAQLDDDASNGLAIGGHVEEDAWQTHDCSGWTVI